jgi:hypothetical protein
VAYKRVVDIGAGGHHHLQRIRLAQEIGGQNLNGGVWSMPTNRPNRFGKMRRAAIGQIVAVNRGHHHMA